MEGKAVSTEIDGATTNPLSLRPRRRLVICCDGTWDNADAGGSASNVVRMARSALPTSADGIPQIVFYHPGVGTSDRLDRFFGGGLGIGLSRAVREAYAFLVNNYVAPTPGEIPGDEIFLFGFSRGAYTARSLAGLIGAIGILHEREMGDFQMAWDWYRLPKEHRDISALDQSFPQRVRDVPIRCIGVWDTVGALGLPRNIVTGNWHPCASSYRFHDTNLGSHVDFAFQALSIDERRKPFSPVPWTLPANPRLDQIIRQVWFAGAHADVGGGYPDHGAADIPFIWMAAQVAPLLDLDKVAITDERDTRETYGQGTVHNEYRGFWCVAGALNRSPTPAAGQYVHRSAVDRAGMTGYPTNPHFARFQALPVWESDAFENSYRWGTGQPADQQSRPGLPSVQAGLCDRVIGWLQGQ